MRTTWKPEAGTDILRLKGSRLECASSGASGAIILEITEVYEGEQKFAQGGPSRANPNLKKVPSLVRSYGANGTLTRLTRGQVVNVTFVVAEFDTGYYAGLKAPQLSMLSEVESQMTTYICEVAKARLRGDKKDPAVPQISSAASQAEELLGINMQGTGFGDDDDFGEIVASDNV